MTQTQDSVEGAGAGADAGLPPAAPVLVSPSARAPVRPRYIAEGRKQPQGALAPQHADEAPPSRQRGFGGYPCLRESAQGCHRGHREAGVASTASIRKFS